MNRESFLEVPGHADAQDVWALRNWLPQPEQVRMALQLRINEVVGTTADEQENEADLATTSMRQGIGLIVALGLAAGALPFLVNWISAARIGTSLPLLRLAQQMDRQSAGWRSLPWPFEVWVETTGAIAGLDPRLPGWLAALLSALGEWVNWPLSWLTIWLVYGLGILAVSKLLGATGVTLQRFYAATAYAYTPLLLTALTPIPCVGALAGFVAVAWMGVMYIHAVYVVTRLDIGRAILAVVIPAAVAVLVGIVMAGALLTTLVGAWL